MKQELWISPVREIRVLPLIRNFFVVVTPPLSVQHKYSCLFVFILVLGSMIFTVLTGKMIENKRKKEILVSCLWIWRMRFLFC